MIPIDYIVLLVFFKLHSSRKLVTVFALLLWIYTISYREVSIIDATSDLITFLLIYYFISFMITGTNSGGRSSQKQDIKPVKRHSDTILYLGIDLDEIRDDLNSSVDSETGNMKFTIHSTSYLLKSEGTFNDLIYSGTSTEPKDPLLIIEHDIGDPNYIYKAAAGIRNKIVENHPNIVLVILREEYQGQHVRYAENLQKELNILEINAEVHLVPEQFTSTQVIHFTNCTIKWNCPLIRETYFLRKPYIPSQ